MSKQSKFISRVLRHEPEAAGLSLLPGGWVRIEDLLQGMKHAGHCLSVQELHQLVEENDKRRFSISSDGTLIRAAQGHSVDVDLGLEAIEPPEALYHGTARSNLESIFSEGLNSGRRQQVHLSPDYDAAKRVGQRHGKPTVLRVGSGDMHRAGHLFYRADNGVWLTDMVPVQFLGFN
ncbi:RNA 2'-phosphotransferase [Ruegeria sp. MALMAid1280]|uniref:RNA 2'-phosphotransferase n=1 Tax=Ruegeria sp. MALMAid1280 TaxID=3411634 RepID=UPI003B9FD519